MQPAAFLCVICVICGRITRKRTLSILLKWNPNVSRWSRRFTQTNNKTAKPHQTVFLCVIMQLAAFLCVICVICGRITRKSTQSISTNETPVFSRRSRRFTQTKPQTTITTKTTITAIISQPSPTCLSLRNNAACCIPLHDLRNLRENTRKSTQSICTEETPMSPADSADLRRRNPKQQNNINHKQIVFLCEIMQPAAFLCVICVICGRIFTWEYSINPHRRNPNISRRSRRFTQTNNKTTKQP